MAPKKLIKPGRVVVVLGGRYAGRKAVVVKAFDEGTSERKFGHAIVAGIAAYPKKVTKAMSVKKIKSRSQLKPFVRFVNYNHMLPTRYNVEFELRKDLAVEGAEPVTVDEATLKDKSVRDQIKKAVKGVLQHNYDKFDDIKDGKAKTGAEYLYTRLRF